MEIFFIIFFVVAKAYEDVLRHRVDKEVNSKKVKVLRKGALKSIEWRHIKCGDIVRVDCDAEFPCDLVLLYSKSDSATCHIQTSNLDGETNLKVRCVPQRFPHFHLNQTATDTSHATNNGNEEVPDDLVELSGLITYEKPNNRLYDFKGSIQVNQNTYSISNDNVLLRGTKLKIAPHIYGCAIYTGKETKMMQNFNSKSRKRSCVERRLNKYMIFFLVLLVLITLVCLFGSFFYESLYTTHWYLNPTFAQTFISQPALQRFVTFMFYMNINYLIPLSLYITMGTIP